MFPGFSEVKYQTCAWAVVCWEATVPDASAWCVKCRDEWLWIKASGQCQVYQIELQTAPGSASKGCRHKSKSNLPTSAVWAGLATCHASVFSATVWRRESNYSSRCHRRVTVARWSLSMRGMERTTHTRVRDTVYLSPCMFRRRIVESHLKTFFLRGVPSQDLYDVPCCLISSTCLGKCIAALYFCQGKKPKETLQRGFPGINQCSRDSHIIRMVLNSK